MDLTLAVLLVIGQLILIAAFGYAVAHVVVDLATLFVQELIDKHERRHHSSDSCDCGTKSE